MTEPLRIVGLRAENFKRLVAVDIHPDGNIVEIRGENAQGKSSILDAIWTALRSADLKLEKPLRDGTQHGYITLDMGRLKVTRTFTEKNPLGYLKVESADGFKASSPQKVVDALFNAIAFDPLAFADMKPAEQVAELRRVARLEVDIDALDRQREALFAERTAVNRDVRQHESAAAEISVPDDTPDEDVDEGALVGELEAAGAKNAARERELADRQQRAQRVTNGRADVAEKRAQAGDKRAEAARLIDEAAKLEAQAAELEQRVNAFEQETEALPPIPEPVDTAAVTAKISEARAINHRVGLKRRKASLAARAAHFRQQSEALTQQIADIDAQKAKAIAEANMPVEGLGLADGGVTYNGVPFAQASKAEQIKVGMAIAVAANPTLRVVTIKDASLLDKTSRATIEAMAAEHGLQVWLELVAEGDTGFIIEAGRVVGSDFAGELGEEDAAPTDDAALFKLAHEGDAQPLIERARGIGTIAQAMDEAEPKPNPLMYPTDLNRLPPGDGLTPAQRAAQRARERAGTLPGLALE